jgi:hypothetical protein
VRGVFERCAERNRQRPLRSGEVASAVWRYDEHVARLVALARQGFDGSAQSVEAGASNDCSHASRNNTPRCRSGPGGERLLPRRERPGAVIPRLRRANFVWRRKQTFEARPDPDYGGLDERSFAILRCDELGYPANVGRQERNPMVQTLVDDVRRVVEQRGHDGDRSRLFEQRDRLRLVEVGLEANRCQRRFGGGRQQAFDLFRRPYWCGPADEQQLHSCDEHRIDGVDGVDERRQSLSLFEPPEKRNPAHPTAELGLPDRRASDERLGEIRRNERPRQLPTPLRQPLQ